MVCHESYGAPLTPLADGDEKLSVSLALARSAAGAIAVVGARLLTRLRLVEGALLPDLSTPVRPEPGITTPNASASLDRRNTLRALASAEAECEAAATALVAADAAGPVRDQVEQLMRIGERIGELLNRR